LLDAKRLSSHFLNHYFNAEETQRRLKGIATRAVSQSNISATRLRGFSIPLPSIKEQDEIVEALDVVDLKTESHRRKHATLSDLFRTLLHQLMTGQTRNIQAYAHSENDDHESQMEVKKSCR
jgi:type I restriction enzyme, S subunit